jgi:hypothetical protein
MLSLSVPRQKTMTSYNFYFEYKIKFGSIADVGRNNIFLSK